MGQTFFKSKLPYLHSSALHPKHFAGEVHTSESVVKQYASIGTVVLTLRLDIIDPLYKHFFLHLHVHYHSKVRG